MRLPRPKGSRPAWVRDPDGERVLAAAPLLDADAWLIGTRRRLCMVALESAAQTWPWEEILTAEWDAETGVLRVRGMGEYAAPRPERSYRLDSPDLLLQLVRERVSASIVLQRRAPLPGSRAELRVIGRRSPMGGPVGWFVDYPEGVDPDDPAVSRLAEAAIQAASEEIGADEFRNSF